LDVWLIPALVVLLVAVWIFYLVMRVRGGTGTRTDGRTLVDAPDDEQDPGAPNG
jgi:hypothetical protein